MTANASGYAINTYSFILRDTAAAALEQWAGRGHATFELMMYPGHIWPADMDAAARRDFRRLLADRGLTVTTLNMPNIDLNLAGGTAEMRNFSRARLGEVVRLAGDLGVPGVVVGPGKPNPLLPAPVDQLTGYFYEALDELVPLAAEVGTECWIENMPFAFLPAADAMMRAIETYDDPGLGVVYDLANAAFIGEDLADGLRRVAGRLKLVHLSDTPRDIYRHAPVGEGIVDFASVVPVLEEIGYTGPPMLEIISPDPESDLPASIAALDAMGWNRIAAQ